MYIIVSLISRVIQFRTPNSISEFYITVGSVENYANDWPRCRPLISNCVEGTIAHQLLEVPFPRVGLSAADLMRTLSFSPPLDVFALNISSKLPEYPCFPPLQVLDSVSRLFILIFTSISL